MGKILNKLYIILLSIFIFNNAYAGDFLQTSNARFEENGIMTFNLKNVDAITNFYTTYQWGDRTKLTLYRGVNRDYTSIIGKYDNSLDVKFLLSKESKYFPAIALGLESIAGNYYEESEFLSFSKRYYNWDFHTSLNWGPSFKEGNIKNPFSIFGSHFSRDNRERTTGDRFENLFTGERVSLSGGISYEATDNLKLNLEYNDKDWSNFYLLKKAKSPISFSADYNINNFTISAGVENMNKLMTKLTYKYDTKKIIYPYNEKVKEIRYKDNGKVNINPNRIILKANMKDIQAYGSNINNGSADLWLESSENEQILDNIFNASRVIYRNTNEDIKRLNVIYTKNDIKGVKTSILKKDLKDVDTKNGSIDKMIRKAEFTSAYREEPINAYSNFFTSYGFTRLVADMDISQRNRSMVHRLSLLAGLKTNIYKNSGWSIGITGRLNLNNNMKDDIKSYKNVSSEKEYTSRFLELENLYVRRTYRPLDSWYLDIQAGFLEERFYGISSELLYKPTFSKWGIGFNMDSVHSRYTDDMFLSSAKRNYMPGITLYYEPDSLKNTILKLSYSEYVAQDEGASISAEKTFDNGIKIKAYSNFSDKADEDYKSSESFRVNAGLRLSFPMGYGSRNYIDANFVPLNTFTARSIQKPENLYNDINSISYNKIVKSFHKFK